MTDTGACGFERMARVAAAVGANTAVQPRIGARTAGLREGDRGINHTRVTLELSHPAPTYVVGYANLVHPDENPDVSVPTPAFSFQPGDTRASVGVTIANDLIAEPDRTVELELAGLIGADDGAGPIAVAIRDDDAVGVVKPSLRRRGRFVYSAGPHVNPVTSLSSPDGTNVEQVFSDDAGGHLRVEDWAPNGRYLLLHRVALDLQDQLGGGEAYRTLPVDRDGRPTGAPQLVTDEKILGAGAELSPDGTVLGFSQYGVGAGWGLVMQSLDAAGRAIGSPRDVSASPQLAGWYATKVTWAPDGRHVAFEGCEPGIDRCGIFAVAVDVHGAPTGAPTPVLSNAPDGLARFSAPAWSPDGRFIAYHATRRPNVLAEAVSSVERVQVAAEGTPTGAPVAISTLLGGGSAPSWAPDGRALSFIVAHDPAGARFVGAVVAVPLDGDARAAGAPIAMTPFNAGPLSATWGPGPADVTPPTTTAATEPAPDANGVHVQDASVTLTAVDDADGDGVASITYALADANATTVPGDRATLVIRSQGTTRVRYFATDRAGNAESVHELGVRIEHPPPAASPSPAAPVPAGMPAKPTPPLAAATLPSNRACVSRRSFRIRLARPPNDPATRAVVTVNGKRVKVVRGARLTAPVDLRGLPKGKVTVKVVLTTRSGKRLTASRTYRTCVPKRPRRRGL